MRKRSIIISKEKIIELIENFHTIPIQLLDIDLKRSLEIAFDYNIYAYDAIYLETAKRLNLPLLSFDKGMRRIGQEIGVTLLGEI